MTRIAAAILILTFASGLLLRAQDPEKNADLEKSASRDRSPDRTEITELFSEGKSLYRQGIEISSSNPNEAMKLYRDALLRFDRIVSEGGVENGKLYYNMGNIYFRLGDIGPAILYYRKAQALMPNDGNLIHNLNFARSRRIDTIEEKETSKILKTVFFWHYDFPAKTRLILFSCFFGLIWLFACLNLFIKRSRWIWGMAVSVFIACLFAGSLAAGKAAQTRNPAGVIFAREVIARKGDSDSYQPSFKEPLHAGTEFLLLEKRLGWYHIELTDGRRSWVQAKEAGIIE